jgi:flagellin-specific chaperone FliS
MGLPVFLCLLLPAVCVRADEQADLDFLKSSAALDRALIPALVAVRAGDLSKVGEQLERVRAAWDRFQADEQAILSGASGWPMIREGIGRRLEMAQRFVGNGDLSMARLVLDQMLSDLVRLRQSLDRATFIDRLVGFRDAMDAALAEVLEAVEAQDFSRAARVIGGLEDAWQAIEAVEVNREVYGLLWQDGSELKDRIREVSRGIGELGEAVDVRAVDEVDGLVAGVRALFIDVYLFFGE